MQSEFSIFPQKASTIAESVDLLYYFLSVVTVFFTVLIFSLVFYFALRYRRRSPADRPRPIEGSNRLEAIWSIVPLLLTMVMFGWGAALYFANSRPPDNAIDIYVVGKQWMWKLQHTEGRREINELHVPVGVPVRLIMTSEDVIHSFFVPAFRIKHDVVPGRYTTQWFQATKAGRYHLFCAEYCGTKHSGMIGSVVVMEVSEYVDWLGGGATGESMASQGERLFQQLGCSGCHRPDAHGRGPVLEGVFNSPVRLESGETVIADEAYLRESILNPRAKVVVGFRPIMPTFAGQVSEEALLQLIAYIKTLARPERTPVSQTPERQAPAAKGRTRTER